MRIGSRGEDNGNSQSDPQERGNGNFLRITGTAHHRLLKPIVLEVSPESAHGAPPSEHSVWVHCVASARNVPRIVRLDDFVEVRGMRVFSRLDGSEGGQGSETLKPPDYEQRFIEPDRPFSMDMSRLPNHGHEPAMWKQDLYTTEHEGLRFSLARKAAGHGRCKIAEAFKS